MKGGRRKPLPIGSRFGRLTVLSRVETPPYTKSKWLCQCDCGNQVTVLQNSLVSGNSRSCGCLMMDVMRARATIPGSPNEPLQQVWRDIKKRCYNPNDRSYRNYGARGIKLHDRWHDYKVFRAEVGLPPEPGLSLDRIDNDGNYEPGNVRWVTMKQQLRNRRNTRYGTAWGVTKPLAEWAEEHGLSRTTLYGRLDRRGMSLEDALTVPTDKVTRVHNDPRTTLLTYKGETKTLREWSEATGLTTYVLRNRRNAGWPVERIFTEPVRASPKRTEPT